MASVPHELMSQRADRAYRRMWQGIFMRAPELNTKTMKTYKTKIKSDKMSVSSEWLEIELTEEEVKDLVRQMENKGEKYFFPEEDATYYFIDSKGVISDYDYDNVSYDNERIQMGVYRTQELAEKSRDKQLALVRMWKWVQENGLFWEPDWKNGKIRYYPTYVYVTEYWNVSNDNTIRYNFLFPYLKTSEDCQKFIDNNLSDLNLFI